MNAEQMFKELGYEKSIHELGDYTQIKYYKKLGDDWWRIDFLVEGQLLYTNYNYESMKIDLKTYKAITQQAKELGWID